MRFNFLCLAFAIVCVSCNQNNKEQEQPPVVTPEPVVDSTQIVVANYERQLEEADEDISKSIRQLSRLSAQLQDSIEGTEVPPQIQEETINNYRNRLHEVRQVQQALRTWLESDHKAPDSLNMQARKEYLEAELKRLEQLLQETRQVRWEAQTAMKESDRDEY